MNADAWNAKAGASAVRAQSANAAISAAAMPWPRVHRQPAPPDRVMVLRACLGQPQRATSDGVPVDDYFLWSAQDNL
jgi:hypothetical protein